MRNGYLFTRTRSVLLAGWLLLVHADAWAQKDDSVSLVGSGVSLVIDTAVPGEDPIPVSDNRTRLRWGRPSRDAAILVSTSCPGQMFSLTVEAAAVSGGMSTGPVSLVDGMSPVLLVDGMAAGIRGSADVLYTAVADPDQGVGTDVHSITFTMIQP